MDDRNEIGRRTMLQMTAAIAAAGTIAPSSARADDKTARPTGKPGDFDFLTGRWKIANRRRIGETWDEFEGESTVHGILAGVASIEELRIPARDFSGMGLRLLDVERKLWADFWVNAKSGVLGTVPSWGSFVDGVGTWDSPDVDGDRPIVVRGSWDRITKTSCRWYQAVSHDEGKTWTENWVMHWTRV